MSIVVSKLLEGNHVVVGVLSRVLAHEQSVGIVGNESVNARVVDMLDGIVGLLVLFRRS